MPKCSILWCSARKNRYHPQLTLHKLPSNAVLKEKWLDVIGMENINLRLKAVYVCSQHFEETCFNRTLDVLRLHEGAIPSSTLTTHQNFRKSSKQLSIPPSEQPPDIQSSSESPRADEGLPDTHADEPELYDDSVGTPDEVITDTEDDVVVQTRSRDIQDEHHYDPKVHDGYSCNVCAGPIIGFRYCCVMCRDWDMCGACEAAGSHAAHYVLRIPAPRAFAEVQSVLEQIRKALELRDPLCSDAPLLPDATLDADEIKSEGDTDEIKMETNDDFVPCEYVSDCEDAATVDDVNATENHNAITGDRYESCDDRKNMNSRGNDTTGHRIDFTCNRNVISGNCSYNSQNHVVHTKYCNVSTSEKFDTSKIKYKSGKMHLSYLNDSPQDKEMAASKTARIFSKPIEVIQNKIAMNHLDQSQAVKRKPPERLTVTSPAKKVSSFECATEDSEKRTKINNTVNIQPRLVIHKLEIPKGVFRIVVHKPKKS